MNHPFKGQLTIEDAEGSKINVYGTPHDIQILDALINKLTAVAGKPPLMTRKERTEPKARDVFVLELSIDGKPQGAYFTGRTTTDRRGYTTPNIKEAQHISTKSEADFLTKMLKCGRPGGKWVALPLIVEEEMPVAEDAGKAPGDTDPRNAFNSQGDAADAFLGLLGLISILGKPGPRKPDGDAPGPGGKMH